MQKVETSPKVGGLSKIQHFTDLVVWQKAHQLVLAIYRETRSFPADEKFGLTSQIRRSATSISSNIAESFGRQTSLDKIQFYTIARGSNTELQDQLLTAQDLGYLTEAKCSELSTLAVTVNKLINGSIRSLREQ